MKVKICGISTPQVAAALDGVDYAGLVFYPRSPRFIKAQAAAEVAAALPPGVQKVGLFVDSGDDVIEHVLEHVSLDVLQLHGEESCQRVQAIRRRFRLPVIKALRVARRDDLAPLDDYAACADILLFDARSDAPLPGGTGKTFDWRILQRARLPRRWILSGGLNIDNLSAAVRTCAPWAVDVSSGVEDAPGRKSRGKIHAFVRHSRTL